MAGRKRLHGLVYALDEFHLKKYLVKMTNHMLDSAEDARKVLCQSIKEDTKEEFLSYVDMLEENAKTERDKARVAEGAKYAEKMQVEVTPQIKKMLSIGMHDFIWMLR